MRQRLTNMPKRKRNEAADSNSAPNPKSRRSQPQSARLEQTIENACQMLHRALKTARGFERQKLGRRQKTARGKKEEGEQGRLDAEVKALKALDLGVTAERHLYKQLKKTKKIAESPIFSELPPKRHEEPSRDVAASNVTARLFNSNPVREVMPGIMNSIRDILGLESQNGPGKSKGAKNAVSEEGKLESKVEKPLLGPQRGESPQSGDVSMSEADDMDLSRYNSRLASSSGSESDEEEPDNTAATPKLERYDPAADLSLSPSPSVESDHSPPATAVKTGKAMSKEQQPASTTFLPSLMMGGYWSGSESEGDGGAEAEAPQRKNRMGQQARRQLWEKKYGSKAKHLQKQKENESKNRDHGWDPRGRTGSRDDFRGKRGRGRGGAFGSGRPQKEEKKGKDHGTSSNAEPIGQRKPPAKDLAQKPIHPSWEAAKKTKEQKGQAAFRGKKIVFD